MFTAANALARFLIEIAAVAILAVCVHPLAAVAAVIAWGLFAAPKARFHVEPLRLGTQAVVLLGSAAALVTAGHLALGLAFAAVVVLNSGLIALLPDPEWA